LLLPTSLIGTVLAAALFVNTLIVQSNPSVWYLDPLVASLCGAVALVYGLQSVLMAKFRDKVPVFSCSWWFNASSTGPDSSIQTDAEVDVVGGSSDLEMRASGSNNNNKVGATMLSADLV
jgi:hypothetical protein